ncbi:MAG: hypothetical protein ABSH03_21045 [Candidatus Lustribacter sp.]
MNFSRLHVVIVLVALLAIAMSPAGRAQIAPPGGVPADNSNNPTPVPSSPPSPQRGRRRPNPNASGSPNPKASPSETPEPPQFNTLDGVWEIELQPLGQRLATYSHVDIAATGANLTGYYQTAGSKGPKYPMTGSFDGRLISMTVTMPTGNATFNGYVETFADMVGVYKKNDADPGTAFTAEHRKKVKERS